MMNLDSTKYLWHGGDIWTHNVCHKNLSCMNYILFLNPYQHGRYRSEQ